MEQAAVNTSGLRPALISSTQRLLNKTGSAAKTQKVAN